MNRNKSLTFKIVFSLMIIVSLVAVRLFEKEWFPEAFQDFFGSGRYLTEDLPAVGFSDFFSIMLRYAVNSVFSVVLLYLWFPDRYLIRLVIKFYIYAGLALMVLLLLAVRFYHPGAYAFLFYVRRFLIQPMFLFIFLPVFYVLYRRT